MDNLFSRSEETRSINRSRVIKDLQESKALGKFNKNIDAIYGRIEKYKKLPQLNNEEMFRFEVVMLVSAIDYYIHEIIRIGIIQIFENEREETKEYNNFIISLKCVKEAILNPESTEWLKDEINFRNRTQSFQKMDKIKEGLSIIDEKIHKKIKYIAKDMELSYREVEDMINLLVVRRNQISHQCDIPSGKSERESIDLEYIDRRISFVKEFINRIHREIIIY
ncbi:MAG: hypothetical protein CR982_10015 [Candidatus Cloacimonadota bacterium]|nr:MAG: hypothetical protein CR982_10015 [Candidatus Cloacimonadota bacterium]PIE81629.1 MAG: hypothetical protein CSA15_00465 [Candidatus Delongbacteria bacterium]